jgi:hypothetical protein
MNKLKSREDLECKFSNLKSFGSFILINVIFVGVDIQECSEYTEAAPLGLYQDLEMH